MTVAELSAFRTFRLTERPVDEPAPGQVQVQVDAIGLCGSDLHYFAEGRAGDTEARYPQVLGHEPAGTILKTGVGVTGWAPGDRVAIDPPIYCYHCRHCMSGRHNLCDHVRFMSSPEEPGFFRDRANVPAENLMPLPRNLGFAEATLFEPLSIILHSFRFGDPRVGETAAVFGAGPIGLSTIAALRLAGARRIWCVEPVAHRQAMALELGADAVFDPRRCDPVREIWRESGNVGVDVAFDCATKDDTVNQSLYVTRAGGRVVITGLPSDPRMTLDFHHLRRREQSFFPVRRANHTSDHALELLREHARRFTPMLTHRMRLDEIQRAFETLERYEDGVCKIVLYP
ncbi:MAG: alcohol dehydrogenase catalytic domain-containing protein [Bryobacter sp.]|jgi:L-iditol 2-dehydrogenase|nr:alcohol dehydrogenase catalytic domain-containing protein [Bryobacter sp.]